MKYQTKWMLLGVGLFMMTLSPLKAQTGSDMEAVVTKAIDEVILPYHQDFAKSTERLVQDLKQFCSAPDPEGLKSVQMSFETTLLSWSRVEPFRMGPAKENNRFDQLFYWPDRKGRALRKMRKVLKAEDQSYGAFQTLSQKSIAVKGLPALEVLLYGKDHNHLLEDGAFRCAYASATSEVIAQNASDLLSEWQSGHFAHAMRTAGKTDGVYHNASEVVQDLLKISGEQIERILRLKLPPSLGDDIETARFKRAPFWRSGMTASTMIANMDAVAALYSTAIDDVMLGDKARFTNSLAFELRTFSKSLKPAEGDWENALKDPKIYGKLRYSLLPLNGALNLVKNTYPENLGLTLGFNSLDGD